MDTFRDITDQKEIEKALRRSEELYRRVVEDQAEFVCRYLPNGTLTFVNKAFCRYFGKTEKELIHAHAGLKSLVFKEDRKIIMSRKKEVTLEFPIVTHEIRVYSPENEVRWNHWSERAIFDKKGKIIEYQSTGRDITQRKVAELLLKKEKERQKLLSEAGKILVASLDYESAFPQLTRLMVPAIADFCIITMQTDNGEQEHCYLAHSDQSAQQWAYEKMTDREARKLLHHPVTPQMETTLKIGQPVLLNYSGENEANQKEPPAAIIREMNISSSIISPLIAREQIFGALHLVLCDPGREYGEDDLAFAQELAQRVTLAIENIQLYKKAQQAAEDQKELVKLKDHFMSVASHELRSPLTAIKGYSQILQKQLVKIMQNIEASSENSQERSLRALDSILLQTDRIGELIHRLLDYTKIQEGKLELVYSRCASLVETIRRVAESQKVANQFHSITVAEDIPEIACAFDETRIVQVLNNLITNAIKYSPAGTTITIGMHEQESPAEIIVWVKDEGCGIEKEAQSLVFERFYRHPDTELSHIEGLGLGLFISNEIVIQHNGKMWLESEPGKGSIFYFSLPFSSQY